MTYNPAHEVVGHIIRLRRPKQGGLVRLFGANLPFRLIGPGREKHEWTVAVSRGQLEQAKDQWRRTGWGIPFTTQTFYALMKDALGNADVP